MFHSSTNIPSLKSVPPKMSRSTAFLDVLWAQSRKAVDSVQIFALKELIFWTKLNLILPFNRFPDKFIFVPKYIHNAIPDYLYRIFDKSTVFRYADSYNSNSKEYKYTAVFSYADLQACL